MKYTHKTNRDIFVPDTGGMVRFQKTEVPTNLVKISRHTLIRFVQNDNYPSLFYINIMGFGKKVVFTVKREDVRLGRNMLFDSILAIHSGLHEDRKKILKERDDVEHNEFMNAEQIIKTYKPV